MSPPGVPQATMANTKPQALQALQGIVNGVPQGWKTAMTNAGQAMAHIPSTFNGNMGAVAQPNVQQYVPNVQQAMGVSGAGLPSQMPVTPPPNVPNVNATTPQIPNVSSPQVMGMQLPPRASNAWQDKPIPPARPMPMSKDVQRPKPPSIEMPKLGSPGGDIEKMPSIRY